MSEQIETVALHEAARTRYLNYAMSVITSRALPDVRDGLKPVQRRILYTMFENLRLLPDAKHRKSAAIVGDVMGKYHPHGDQSIYDAMVRMAQDFSLRYPLIDGQGNFGSLDGDSAAAMRYTEAKLRHLAVELLSELRKSTVDYRPNYEGTIDEPLVLPAQVPNLLINGVTGIAVGMATNIPPHNLHEVISALVALIDDPSLTVEQIIGPFIQGPDFPTGGEILNTHAELVQIYSTGSGGVIMRGQYTVEEEARRRSIVITSIPYTLNRAELVTDIADHVRTGKLPQLVDVRDESTDEMRIVLDLAKGAEADVVMAYLYRKTALETRFNVNMTALVPTPQLGVMRPERLDIVTVLHHFLAFRREVVERRLRFDLEQLERRIHLLKGFVLIFDALDEAIALIRSSKSKDDARKKLIERFGLDYEQAEAILETKLYRLATMEILEIRRELAEKEGQAAELRSTLSSEERMWGLIRSELLALRDAYGDARRTKVTGPRELPEVSEAMFIVAEDAWVMVSRDGWYKRQKSYTDAASVRVREGDALEFVVQGSTRETLILFTDRGRAYTMRIAEIVQTTGHGEPISARFSFADGEKIVGVSTSDGRMLPPTAGGEDDAGPLAMFVTKAGRTARFALRGFFEPSTVNGRIFARLETTVDADGVVAVRMVGGDEKACLISRQGRALVFAVSEASLLSGAGKGVTAVKLAPNDHILAWTAVREMTDGLLVETNRGRKDIVSPKKIGVASRAARGRPLVGNGYIARVENPLTVCVPWKPSDVPPVAVSAPRKPAKVALSAAPTDETAPVEPFVVVRGIGEPGDPDDEGGGGTDQGSLF